MSKVEKFPYPAPEVLADPYPFYEAMRSEQPVYREPKSGTYFVSRYEDVSNAVRNPVVFSSKRKLIPTDDAEISAIRAKGFPDSISLTAHDPPEHQRYRSLVNRIFTPRHFKALEPKIRALANSLVDQFIGDGKADLHRQFSIPLPLTVIADLLDLDHADLPDLKFWSDDYARTMAAQASPMARDQMVRCATSLTNLQLYFSDVVDQRRAKPGHDLISQLLEGNAALETPLNQAELVDMLRIFLIGGNETTTLAFSSLMGFLLSEPANYERVKQDPKLIGKAIEETLRLQSPTQWVLRNVTEDTELGGVHLPAGAKVCLLWGSANRDPAKFGDNADRFDLDRPDLQAHLAFGYGSHFCSGAVLARLELVISLETMIARLKNLRLAGADAVVSGTHPILRGPSRVEIEFDPA